MRKQFPNKIISARPPPLPLRAEPVRQHAEQRHHGICDRAHLPGKNQVRVVPFSWQATPVRHKVSIADRIRKDMSSSPVRSCCRNPGRGPRSSPTVGSVPH